MVTMVTSRRRLCLGAFQRPLVSSVVSNNGHCDGLSSSAHRARGLRQKATFLLYDSPLLMGYLISSRQKKTNILCCQYPYSRWKQNYVSLGTIYKQNVKWKESFENLKMLSTILSSVEQATIPLCDICRLP